MDRDLQGLLDLLAGADTFEVGIGVTVREFLRRKQFVETLNELLPWDESQCAVSPGQRLLALVMAYIELCRTRHNSMSTRSSSARSAVPYPKATA